MTLSVKTSFAPALLFSICLSGVPGFGAETVPYATLGIGQDGRCASGVFINPGRNESCDQAAPVSTENRELLMKSVGSAKCDVEELIGIKEKTRYILDQFLCSKDALYSSLCAGGLAGTAYVGLKFVSNQVTKAEAQHAMLSTAFGELDSQRKKAANVAVGLIKRGKVDQGKLILDHASQSGPQHKALRLDLQKIEAELVAKKGVYSAAKKFGLGTGLLSAALLVYDFGHLAISKAGAPTLTDEYKSLEGLVKFSELSDERICQLLAIPENGLSRHFVSLSWMLQNEISKSMPLKAIHRCDHWPKSAQLLTSERDGTHRMLTLNYSEAGSLSRVTGYRLVDPMSPDHDINFSEREDNVDFIVELPGSRPGFVQAGSRARVEFSGATDSVSKVGAFSAAQTRALEETRRFGLIAPTLAEACRAKTNPVERPEVQGVRIKK